MDSFFGFWRFSSFIVCREIAFCESYVFSQIVCVYVSVKAGFSLAEFLTPLTYVASPSVADKEVRYTDTLITEQERGCTFKATPISLVSSD